MIFSQLIIPFIIDNDEHSEKIKLILLITKSLQFKFKSIEDKEVHFEKA